MHVITYNRFNGVEYLVAGAGSMIDYLKSPSDADMVITFVFCFKF